MEKEIIKENYIYKFKNIVDYDVCSEIKNFYIENYSNNVNDVSKLPWYEEDTFYWSTLKETKISNLISLCRNKITECVENSYNEKVYSNTTTLVMWKEGKSMGYHKDNGYDNDKHILHMRKYTAVMYINDDYDGGETVVLKENSQEPEIINKGETASVLIFRSDDSCVHGVHKIKKGKRLTLSMWFTTEEKYKEI